MTQAQDPPRAQIGDLVIVEGHRVGEARRIGEILELLGEPGHEYYRVSVGTTTMRASSILLATRRSTRLSRGRRESSEAAALGACSRPLSSGLAIALRGV
jgi:uncharacterized protein DUF1918